MENNTGHNKPPTDAEYLQNGLKDNHEKLLESADKLLDAATRLPAEVTDEETAGKVSDYIKLVTGCMKNLEGARISEKEPFLSLGRVVDGFFKRPIDSLDMVKRKAQRPLDAFLIAKANAERKRREEIAAEEQRKAKAAQEEAMRLAEANKPKEADKAMETAAIAENTAAKLEKAAEVKPAELARSRGESGALASLRTTWVGEITDIAALNLETLRHHIHPEALQKAVNSFVKAGGREMPGVRIYEKSETVVR